MVATGRCRPVAAAVRRVAATAGASDGSTALVAALSGVGNTPYDAVEAVEQVELFRLILI